MFLANANAFKSADELRKRHACAFGQWLRDGKPLDLKMLERAAAAVPEAIRQSWLAAAAEEWLCSFRGEGVEGIPGFLEEARPFGSGPKLAEFCGLRAAVSVIPLDRKPAGEMARVWVVADSEGTLAGCADTSLEGAETHFPKQGHWRLFMAGADSTNVTGQSWQLGAVLARTALERSHSAATDKLAGGWIVTGRVSAAATGAVEHVGIGAKSWLPENERDALRNWLLPAANELPAEKDYQELASRTAGRLHFAKNLSDAWGHLTGEGMQIAADEPWPNDFAEVHGFVSNSQGPFLAMILQTVALRGEAIRVVLWATNSMRSLAVELRQSLLVCCERLALPEPEISIEKAFDATDKDEPHILNRTQRDLAKDPSLGSILGPKILFNYNGGTILHRTAVQQRAALNERIWLAYRDGDHKGTLDFTFIRLHLGTMIEGRLKLRPDACAVAWQALADHWRLAPKSQIIGPRPTSDEQISALVAKAIPESEKAGHFISA